MIEVFGADEQSVVDIDLSRWVRLARLVLAEERVPGVAELSLIFVDRQAITDLNERFLGGTGPTDVLAFPMDDDVVLGGRQPDQGGRGPGAPAEAGEPPTLIGDVVVCPEVAAEQAPAHGASRRMRSRCSSSTACSICSTMTMPIRKTRRRCSGESASCSRTSATRKLSADRPRV